MNINTNCLSTILIIIVTIASLKYFNKDLKNDFNRRDDRFENIFKELKSDFKELKTDFKNLGITIHNDSKNYDNKLHKIDKNYELLKKDMSTFQEELNKIKKIK